ncbi:MAG: FAD-dependent thymidylate synthase [Silvibacterium sp.]|nr:FAD-dependent thymidylate synthase [Silvibacterium sp.]MBV8438698.1 FAD-dependent thymidylate synthase [Silvibacterium sp.]
MPKTEVMPASSSASEQSQNQTEVFAVHGADPEVLAYAMAKYSRSSLSMRDSLREISSQRAEQFLNTFYFQYGHRSIADLAHLAFAIERLSLLAAIVLVDEQRWDGQERSTRYQNFRKSGWYMPDFGGDQQAAARFRESVESLFAAYHEVAEGMLESLKAQVPCPAEMKPDAYERTLRARAFDVARYLLPLATNTSLGQIVNARTLETQISRLLSSPYAEIRQLGEKLRAAATGAAWNVHADEFAKLQQEIAALDPTLGERAAALLTREVRTAPTLVKYAAPNEYEIATRRELHQAATELLSDESIDPAPSVDLIDNDESLEVELATTLLYGACHYPYRQIRRQVAALDEARRNEIIALGTRHRGRHDELLREFASGKALKFDILMDIGGFRDMHRHRRCIQVLQDFTSAHGFEIPEGLAEAGLQPRYESAMHDAHAACAKLAQSVAPEYANAADYLLPLGTRTRALFKMDFAEAVYISELRSQPQGHFSYRRIAWELYEAVRKQHPSLAQYFRVTDVNEPVDLLKR